MSRSKSSPSSLLSLAIRSAASRRCASLRRGAVGIANAFETGPADEWFATCRRHPAGAGYCLVASDGGIFAFDADFSGSTGHIKLNKPISGIVPGSGGYMMVAEDGGIFAFGNVKFHGSLGANPPARPVVAVALMS